ncbi:MAG: Na/Pi cotransporter family protein [Treponema sp.]
MIKTILQFAGSLCFLLYGMKLMSDGIQKSGGEKLQKALHFMTGSKIKGLLTGCLLTMVIQSSGATTVMVVTFVNAGLITLEQSIAVIFGANIGTTITAWIVALFGFNFKIENFAIPIFGIGFLLTSIRKWHKQGIGQAIMGFGILFIALSWLSSTITLDGNTLSFLPAIQNWGIWSILLAFAIGIFFTALIHSSSAMTAIVITMAYNHLISWEFSAAIVIGSNIGSTVDSIMASFGAKVNAKRTALVHVLFNCTTAILALIFIKPFCALIDLITPGTIAENITYHIAMLHTCFNIAGTLIFIPWTKQIARLTEKLIKPDASETPVTYTLTFPEKTAVESPAACVITAQKEVTRMADIAVQMFDRLQYGFTDRSGAFLADHYQHLSDEENYIDQMHEQLTKYLIKAEQLDIDERLHNNISVMIQIIEEIESMSDDCMSIGIYIKKITEKQYIFPKEDFDRLLPYLELSRELLYFVYKNINSELKEEQVTFAHEIETQIDSERKNLKKLARSRLEQGANVKAELLYIDLVRHIEKIGDRCFAIAEQLKIQK